jgi:transcriptional regulator with XRE-family HTH domain
MLSTHEFAFALAMPANDEQFFKALGTRVAELRKEQGLSQQALADQLGIPQQTYANYEVARARIPASMLPQLARLFGVGVDELLGLRNGTGKRGPTPKFQKQLERIAQLPRAKQRVVIEMLDGVLTQAGRT